MTTPTTKDKKGPGGRPGRDNGTDVSTNVYTSHSTTIPLPSQPPLTPDAQLAAAGLAYEMAGPMEAGELFLAWLELFCAKHGHQMPDCEVRR